jgi:electron transport complex protein RnfG
MSAPAAFQPKPDVPAWRLLVTLGVAGALAGFLLVFVFQVTAPIIERNKAERLAAAVQEVLKGPVRYDTLFVIDDRLTDVLPDGVDARSFDQVYRGYDADGQLIGYAMAAGEPGFQDIVRLIFGYDYATSTLLGMKVLESKETPGLGDKIEKDMGFVGQFDGATAPLVGVKPRDGTGDPHEVDMITGATISSRTVIKVINNALSRLDPMLEASDATVTARGSQELRP